MSKEYTPKVFISYSWDDNHSEHVKTLADTFRTYGVDCYLDRYTSNEVWNDWMQNGIHNADFILVICGKRYREKFDIHTTSKDSGVFEEAEKVRDRLKKTNNDLSKIFRLFFGEINDEYTPNELIRCSATNCKDHSSLNQLYRHITGQKDEIPPLGEIVEHLPLINFDKAQNIQKTKDILVPFLKQVGYTLNEFKALAKIYSDRYHVANVESLEEAIVDLDGVMDDEDNPLACIVNHIYREKNIENSEIKVWLIENFDSSFCQKSKNRVAEKREKIVLEDRIIVEFEPIESSSNFNVFIRYFKDEKFQSGDEAKFENINIDSSEFQKEFVNELYDESGKEESYLNPTLYEHLDIFLPKEALLIDIKQWKSSSRKRLTRSFKVNIHVRERAYVIDNKRFIELWNKKLEQLPKTLENSLKTMKSEDDEVTKDTQESGVVYQYLPTCKDTFSDDMRFTLIAVRCGESEEFDKYQKWWRQNSSKMKLSDMKSFIDNDANKEMTLIWDDPNIPMKRR
jgi:hypothetical protein